MAVCSIFIPFSKKIIVANIRCKRLNNTHRGRLKGAPVPKFDTVQTTQYRKYIVPV